MSDQAKAEENNTQELYRRFMEVAIGWGRVTSDEIPAVAGRAICLGERLLEVYRSQGALHNLADVAYHLITPYEERADYYSHHRTYQDENHPVDLPRAIDDYSRAIELLQVELSETVIASQDRLVRLLKRRAECYLRVGDHAKGLRDAQELMSAKPDAETYLLRGRCRLAMGRRDEAAEDAKRATQTRFSDGFGLYRECYPEVAAKHDLNLQSLLTAYEKGERDFRGIDLSWTDLSDRGKPSTDLRNCILDHANLRYCDLTGASFADASLRHARLDHAYARKWMSEVGVDFSGADLTLASLQGTNFKRPDFRGAILKNADLSGASYSSPEFAGAELEAADLRMVHWTDPQMAGLDLTGLDIRDAHLTCAMLDRACLKEAKLGNCDLTQSHLENADLTRANLRSANLDEVVAQRARFTGAILDEANCIQADFSGAELRSASLVKTFLRGTNLSDADLSEVDLSNSDMGGASINDNTVFRGATMPDGKRFSFLTRLRKYTA